MCVPGLDPMTIGMIASAVGGGAQLINQNQALKRQDRETARGIATRSALSREAGGRVQQQIQDIAASSPDVERKVQNDAFMAALRKAKVADGSIDIGAPGAVSDRFAADVGSARRGATGEGMALSGQLAAIDAPGLQRQREARGFTDTAIDLDRIRDRSSGQDFLTQLRTANAGRTNPLVDAFGQGLQAFGSVYAGRAPKTPVVPKVPRFLPGAP